MTEFVSSCYLSALCDARDYEGLVWISGMLHGAAPLKAQHPTYGLPWPAFNIVERLSWFAQGIRSGAWTYYEATSPERQNAMMTALAGDKTHPDFVARYAFGMENWRIPLSMQTLDVWLEDNDDLNNAIIWQIVSDNSELIQRLVNR